MSTHGVEWRVFEPLESADFSIQPFESTKPGEGFLAFVEKLNAEITATLAIPADYMKLCDPTLTREEKVMLELKIELHRGWGLYPGQN